MKVTISGFYDEVSTNLDTQIALLNELGEKYLCPRLVDGKNIADYTVEEFVEKVKPRLDKYDIKFSSIGSPIGKVNIDDEAGFEKQLKQLKELVKICEVMDCKYIRMFSFFMPKDSESDSVLSAIILFYPQSLIFTSNATPSILASPDSKSSVESFIGE